MKKLLEIPDDLFRIISHQAKENRRSVTQEIIKILEVSQSTKEVNALTNEKRKKKGESE